MFFKERGSLNTSSGEMTIRGLIRNDSALYTPEINSKEATPTLLTVISSVPVPTVTTSCDEKAGCTLTCEGNTTGAEPVAYKWKSDDTELKPTSKDHHVKKENSPGIKEFSCELVNPVSRESSRPIPNPFIADMPRNLNINTGLAVFLCLLVAVLLLVFIHRGTSGVWFFQKESMPWEADFWTKQERPARDAAESNATRDHQENGQENGETQMTLMPNNTT
uniref:Ig-like domain-containing protein n=1 Tax=Scophthalmus maximus TaxID=52904 RepID=A0A8D3ECU8_SCOMX